MILKIADIKDTILRQKAKRVSKFDKRIEKLISNMQQTLKFQRDPEGIGLAAPQIGKSLQIFIVNFEKLQRVIINPEILKSEKLKKGNKKSKAKLLEGCLSLPNYYSPIRRPRKIKIRYQTPSGQSLVTKVEDFFGFNAQIIQHEIDHLDGKLFIDHIKDPDKLHWVEKHEFPLYRNKEAWRNWPKKWQKPLA